MEDGESGARMKITGINSIHESEASITWEDEVYFWWHSLAGVALTHCRQERGGR